MMILMDRLNQLRYCRLCNLKKMDSRQGLICSRTGMKADFSEDCPWFDGDRSLIPPPIDPESVHKSESHYLDILKVFLPRSGFFVTPIIIYFCVSVFAVMVISGMSLFIPSPDALLKWGANFRPFTLDGQFWRLLTACFLHVDVIHLISNMLALFYIGYLLEPLTGRIYLILAYLLSGLGGSAASLAWNDFLIGAGASGAILGLHGTFIAIGLGRLKQEQNKITLLVSIGVIVVFSLLNGFRPNIDNAAHIGGLLSGFLYGFSLVPLLFKSVPKYSGLLINGFAFLLLLGLFTIIYSYTPRTSMHITKYMEQFDMLDNQAGEILSYPGNSNEKNYLLRLRNTGIKNWQKCKEIIKDVNSLKAFEDNAKYQLDLIDLYCDYRLEGTSNLEKSLVLKEFKYMLEADLYHRKALLLKAKINGEEVPDSTIYIKSQEHFLSGKSDSLLLFINGVFVRRLKDHYIDPSYVVNVIYHEPRGAPDLFGEDVDYGTVEVWVNYKK